MHQSTRFLLEKALPSLKRLSDARYTLETTVWSDIRLDPASRGRLEGLGFRTLELQPSIFVVAVAPGDRITVAARLIYLLED